MTAGNTSLAAMPTTHKARHVATTSTRRFSVTRQSKRAAALMSPARDDGLGGWIRRDDALDHDRFVSSGRDQMQLLGRERLDALGRLQRFDLEAQAAVDLVLRRALALELLDL